MYTEIGENYYLPGNTNRSGRIYTNHLRIEITCFLSKVNNIFHKNELIETGA
jgi:hypothetical protein